MTYFLDYTQPRGYITITKHQDGNSEVLFSDYNNICIGMGQTLANLFDPASNKDVEDFQIRYFQLGKVAGTLGSGTRECSSVFNGADYGANTSLNLEYINIFKESIGAQAAILMDETQITPASSDRVTFSINLGSNDANTTISEVALLSRSPIKGITASPIVAYRTFPTITKTSAFELTIQWTIEF